MPRSRKDAEQFEVLREQMVRLQIAARDIGDPNVLKAFREVPREVFLPEKLTEFACEDTALAIEQGQTISQPYIVALVTQALELKGGERVLEIGTGSGYAAAATLGSHNRVPRGLELESGRSSNLHPPRGSARKWQAPELLARSHRSADSQGT